MKKPYITESHGEHTVNIYDDAPDKKDYRVELTYKGNRVAEIIYPAYRIYTFLAHWTESNLPTEPVGRVKKEQSCQSKRL